MDAVFGVPLHDVIASLLSAVDHMEELQFAFRNHVPGKQTVTEPVDQRIIEMMSDKNQRDPVDFVRLDHGKDFRQLIQSAEPAGISNRGDAVFEKTDFSNEEITELQGIALITIRMLLHRELDIETDGGSFFVPGAAIGGLHETGPAAGKDTIAALGKEFAKMDTVKVDGIAFGRSGGAEDGDKTFETGHGFERVDEFGHDPEDSPRLAFFEIGGISARGREFRKFRHTRRIRKNQSVFKYF